MPCPMMCVHSLVACVLKMTSAGQIAAAYILLFLSNTLSSSAGVGGGLLNVAIFHSILGEGFKDAVILSLATVLGNTLVQLFINIQTRHPTDAKKSVIYWDMLAIMLPAELGGSNLGVILSDIIPSTLLYMCAIVVLMIGGAFSAARAKHLYDVETERNAKKAKTIEGSLETTNPMASNSLELIIPKGAVSAVSVDQVAEDVEKQPISDDVGTEVPAPEADLPDQSSAQASSLPPLELPRTIIGVITGVWLLYLVLYIVLSEVPGCSLGWGLVMVFIYLILIIELPWAFQYLIKQQSQAPDVITSGDVVWDSSTFSIPVVTFTIGLLTALLGFGGGELIGPYLLHLQLQPLVSTSTTGMIGFLNTGLSLVHYAILGHVKISAAFGVFAVGLVGGLCGRLFSLWFVAKYDRASVLVCALVAILGLSWVVYILYIATGKVSFEGKQLC